VLRGLCASRFLQLPIQPTRVASVNYPLLPCASPYASHPTSNPEEYIYFDPISSFPEVLILGDKMDFSRFANTLLAGANANEGISTSTSPELSRKRQRPNPSPSPSAREPSSFATPSYVPPGASASQTFDFPATRADGNADSELRRRRWRV
jgi:hypothetical protein